MSSYKSVLKESKTFQKLMGNIKSRFTKKKYSSSLILDLVQLKLIIFIKQLHSSLVPSDARVIANFTGIHPPSINRMASTVYHVVMKSKCRANCLTVSPNIRWRMQKINNNAYEIKSLIYRLYLDFEERKNRVIPGKQNRLLDQQSHKSRIYSPHSKPLKYESIFSLSFQQLIFLPPFFSPCFSHKTTLRPYYRPVYHTQNQKALLFIST